MLFSSLLYTTLDRYDLKPSTMVTAISCIAY